MRYFVRFINESWDTVIPLLEGRDYTTDESSIADWLQLNWEILVERKVLKINQYLDVYGEGADFNGASSRITDVSVLPNFSIKIKGRAEREVSDLLNDEQILISNGKFIELVTFKDGFYKKEPKFDYVLLEDDIGVERVVPIEDIEFKLEKIK